jgi:hypothetical protein
MIIEGLATTRNADGTVNVAPMGPIVSPDFRSLLFRPFPTSQTFANLRRNRCGVFHVTDDAALIARAALGFVVPVATEPARSVAGDVLVDCCRWYEFVVDAIDESGERPRFLARVTHVGRRRDFLGLNRARHAIIEAAIVATRVHLLGREQVLVEIDRLFSAVDKTGDVSEREAWRLIRDYVETWAKSADAQ